MLELYYLHSTRSMKRESLKTWAIIWLAIVVCGLLAWQYAAFTKKPAATPPPTHTQATAIPATKTTTTPTLPSNPGVAGIFEYNPTLTPQATFSLSDSSLLGRSNFTVRNLSDQLLAELSINKSTPPGDTCVWAVTAAVIIKNQTSEIVTRHSVVMADIVSVVSKSAPRQLCGTN